MTCEVGKAAEGLENERNVGEVSMPYVKQQKGCGMNGDVGNAAEGLGMSCDVGETM